MRRIALLDAPSNLGLRPPTATSVPGCAKAPGALRDHGLLRRLGARDAGCLTPPRYDPGDWRPGDGVCHASAIAGYTRVLADRIGAIMDAGEFPVVLGGDCSIVLGSALAMHRLGEAVGGRIGLVYVDGHSDFRHPGNASYVGAAAGEDLALITGRGQAELAAIEGRRPYFRDIDVVVMGIRDHDEYRLDLQAAGIVTRPVPTLRAAGAARSAQWAHDQLVDCAGYWVHVDVDVLDPAVMPAVDAPEPGGIAFTELELLLAGLVDTPHCLGVEITVFDPDYDTDGVFAEEITATLVAGLAPVRGFDTPTADRARVQRQRQHFDRTGRTGPDGPGADGVPVGPTPGAVAMPVIAALPVTDPVAVPALVPGPASVASSAADAGPDRAAGELLDRHRTDQPTPDPLDVAGADPFGGYDPDEPAGDAPDVEYPGAADPLRAAGGQRAAEAADPPAAGDQPGAGDPLAAADPPGAGDLPDGGDAPDAGDPPGTDPLVDGLEAAQPARPLGSIPLLGSAPMPATRPGLLRPRGTDTFSLPSQRPAFDVGPEAADLG